MLDGCLLWKAEGLGKPKDVADAVAEYKNEMDIISAFVESEFVEKGREVKASDLYVVYCKWADENNEFKMSSTRFGREMAKRYEKKKSKNMVYRYFVSRQIK